MQNLRAPLLALSLLMAGTLAAQQASFNNTGGAVTLGSDFVISGSSVGSPSGTFAFDCPATAIPPGIYSASWVCNGGTISLVSFDGLTAVSGVITSGTLVETASGGGRGGHTIYYYSFSGSFTGTLTVNGQPEAVRGVTSQSVGGLTSPLGTGTIASGITYVNADYEPIYITDSYNYRIVRMDNMNGDNWIALGAYGTGAKQFQLPWGIAVDSAGKIYVSDSAACRVDRMDDMLGTNWTSLGTCGTGSRQFNTPSGLTVDAAGKIYVADAGNNRIVRMDDIAGDNWIVYGAPGSGIGQFTRPEGVTVDAAGKVYVADSGNNRIVRMDNMTGANWNSFGSAGSGTNQFASETAVTLDSAGRMYVVDLFNNRIVRIDDLFGTNWTVLGANHGYQFINPYGATVDPFGTIYIADSRDYRLVMTDDMAGSAWTTFGAGGTGVGQFDSPTTLFVAPAASPIGVPMITATSLAFSNTVLGTASASQTVTMVNIGSAPLAVNSIVASADFGQTNTCVSPLAPAQSCVITVSFKPLVAGARTGTVTLNLGSGVKSIGLKGVGTLVSVSPLAVNFGNVNAGFKPVSMTVTVGNPGAAAAGISSVVMKAAKVYRLINHCPASLTAGTTCTLTVRFSPQAAAIYTGSLTVTDASGTAQNVTITGTGISN